jgi:Flp pilus assembly protein TadB
VASVKVTTKVTMYTMAITAISMPMPASIPCQNWPLEAMEAKACSSLHSAVITVTVKWSLTAVRLYPRLMWHHPVVTRMVVRRVMEITVVPVLAVIIIIIPVLVLVLVAAKRTKKRKKNLPCTRQIGGGRKDK